MSDRLTARIRSIFPARVLGTNGITVTKTGGVYTFSWGIASFSEIDPIPDADFDNLVFPVYNQDTLTHRVVSIESLLTALLGEIADPVEQLVTGSSATVTAGTANLIIQRASVGTATTTIQLPTVAAQNNISLRFDDFSTGIFEHTIRFVPDGSETISTEADWDFVSTDSDRAKGALHPSPTANGWLRG